MPKLHFTFAPLKNKEDAKEVRVIHVDFDGGYTLKYNTPTWEGDWNLLLDNDFFVKGICDGGGWVEVVDKNEVREKIYPICPICGSEIESITDNNSSVENLSFKSFKSLSLSACTIFS